MRVAVLKGGRSLEREVSLRSGANAAAALRRLGHEVIEVDADRSLVRTLRAERPEAAFIALHGRGGEDGTVQELLEILEIPYTGPGVLACERAMDKVVAKAHFEAAGVPTPAAYAFRQEAFRELGAGEALGEIRERLGLPLVVKPAAQGSALGISVAHEPGDIPSALMTALAYDDRVLLERFVPGRELAISVLGTADPWALPVVEAIPRNRDFYDFESRYTPGLTELVAPARLPDEVAQEAARLAIACYRALGCRGVSRVDMILDPDDRLWVLEINAIPGMTDTSLLPKAAEAAGLGFDEVVERILAEAALGA
ncbi:D-alanine--D-alanine ligase family protein [Miltoncostaea marina]|uniref:D-alanine--D-alanine ligase family protein n=1 Tax=Miltoncostaea marina TaxID=2843215 RepID=UPI001C3C7AD3|nr:D-alanine--D-alanine ligase [Miltoncostaea marina]